MATLYTPDGVQAVVKPRKGTHLMLDEAQGLVGGYVEVVPTSKKGVILLINEDGLSQGLALNRQVVTKWDLYVVGNAIECKRSEFR